MLVAPDAGAPGAERLVAERERPGDVACVPAHAERVADERERRGPTVRIADVLGEGERLFP